MSQKLTADEIRGLGFDWPKVEMISEYEVIEGGRIDLSATIEQMESSRAFYKEQLGQAFAFKWQHGADYSDFTDRHEEYSQKSYRLDQAIAYLKEILRAIEN